MNQTISVFSCQVPTIVLCEKYSLVLGRFSLPVSSSEVVPPGTELVFYRLRFTVRNIGCKQRHFCC